MQACCFASCGGQWDLVPGRCRRQLIDARSLVVQNVVAIEVVQAADRRACAVGAGCHSKLELTVSGNVVATWSEVLLNSQYLLKYSRV
jgi:hypothetical protein